MVNVCGIEKHILQRCGNVILQFNVIIVIINQENQMVVMIPKHKCKFNNNFTMHLSEKFTLKLLIQNMIDYSRILVEGNYFYVYLLEKDGIQTIGNVFCCILM